MTEVLIYEKTSPVSSATHRELSIEVPSFEFASKINAVPLTAVEIPFAAREYTIVFAGSKEAVTPMVVLGVEGATNMYLDADNRWKADYVPAFIRRYPFIFSRSEDQKQFTLCIDEDWSGCNTEGRGQRLFDDKGEKTQFTENMLKFLGDFQQQFSRTEVFCKKLVELDVLEPMQANIKTADGKTKSLRGFFSISREKLKSLGADTLADLAKSNILEVAYLQMASLQNLRFIVNRFLPKQPKDVGQEEPAE